MTMRVTQLRGQGSRRLLYTQQHSVASLSLRARQITEINVNINYVFIPEPPSTGQSVIRNMCCLSLTHNKQSSFQAYSYQTSQSALPSEGVQLRRACLAVWEQPTLIMTWLIYSSVAEGKALEKREVELVKQNMRQDSQVWKGTK